MFFFFFNHVAVFANPVKLDSKLLRTSKLTANGQALVVQEKGSNPQNIFKKFRGYKIDPFPVWA